MKAIVLSAFGSIENFIAKDVPIPELRDGEVRIRVKAVSFNPVDYQIRKGRPEGRRLRSMILGRDLSGIVDAVHDEVTEFSQGDEVFAYVCDLASSGTYAEYVSVPVQLVARKPRSLTHEQAASVPVGGITASLALERAWTRETRSLFIAGGAGGVGTFAISIARQRGVQRLVTTAGNAKSRAYLIDHCGLSGDQILDYRDADFIEQATRRNAGGFDVVLDLVGGSMLSACCALLALDGHLASVTEAPITDDFEILFQKNATFHSVGANAYSLTSDRTTWRKYQTTLDRLAQSFDSGALAAPSINILGELSPEIVKLAHSMLESNTVQGKLVMTC